MRLAISQWPDDAPRGAVSTFCAEHGISRKSFYELRKRAKSEGPSAVLEPRSRRPKSSPSALSDEVKGQAVAVRAALEASGLDHGPISVHDKMQSMGLKLVPSTASLVQFHQSGVARHERERSPARRGRRFVYPAPNACWQLDGTEYVLTGGRRCVILQLIDDHSRYAVGSHVASGETADAAIAVFDKAVAAHGVPQRLLTDNGPAFNPSRRGRIGQLVEHAQSLGVETITGKPYKPTTQGKNERFHQTLFRYLDKQPLADTLELPKPRSTRSTTSTTPNGLTKDSPGGSHRSPRGRPRPKLRRHAPCMVGPCSTRQHRGRGPRRAPQPISPRASWSGLSAPRARSA